MEKLEELRRAERMVSLDCLGLCEHCETLLSFEFMSAEALDGEWSCPSCEEPLTHRTWGFEEIEGEWKSTRWVGPEEKWVDEKPTDDFALGSWFVRIDPIGLDPRY